MRSLVFAVVLVLVAPLTVVRSEMNPPLADDPKLQRDDRGTVNFGMLQSPPLIIDNNVPVNGTSLNGTVLTFSSPVSDPTDNIKPEDGIKLLKLMKSKRGQVDIGFSGNTAVFNKRGTINFLSGEARPLVIGEGTLISKEMNVTKTKRGQVDIGFSGNTAVFNKRGTLNFHKVTGDRPAVVDEGKVISEALDKTKTKRGQVDIGFSRNTSVFNNRATQDLNSTVEEPMDDKRTKRGRVGIGASGNTSIFNKDKDSMEE